MAIIHRYIDELESIEMRKVFCNEKIECESNVLIIGTFNPSDNSCKKTNDAQWFYGRKRNKFWKYFPLSLTNENLHQSKNDQFTKEHWKDYCVKNRVVIIDLIKKIDSQYILASFGDREVEDKINSDLSNVQYFDVKSAFGGITFKKVIYSLLWGDNNNKKLMKIRDIVNQNLLKTGCLEHNSQIKYCKTPSRNDALQSWKDAICS